MEPRDIVRKMEEADENRLVITWTDHAKDELYKKEQYTFYIIIHPDGTWEAN